VINRQVSPMRLGHAYSVHSLSGTLGWSVAPPFMVGLSSLGHWSHAYIGAAGIYVVLMALCVWRSPWLETREEHLKQARNPRSDATPSGSTKPPFDVWQLLRMPAVIWSFVFLFCMTMTYSVVQSFLVTILQNMHGISLVHANMTLTAYLLVAALGNLLGGFVTSRWGAHADRIVAVCMGVASVWMLISATGWLGANGTPVSLILTALAVGMGAPARDLMIKKATPVGATGRVYGLVFAGLDVGSAVSPLIFGPLMDHGHDGLTLAGAAFFLLCGGLVSLALTRNLARAPTTS
jgi:predicted MFS family arabinose efflux permease